MTVVSNDIRLHIQSLIDQIEPFDAEERTQIAFILGWLSTGVEIFRIAKPATPDTHLVSYFILIDEIHKKTLLVDHKKAGLWLPPGGHVEPNEDPKETVKREIFEELGIHANFLYENPFFVTVTKTVGLYHTRPQTLNLDASETKPNRSEAPRKTRPAPGGLDEEEDRFGKVAASLNSKFGAECGLTAGHTDVSLWYVLKGNSEQNLNFDQEEFNDIRWFDINNIPYENSDPHMERFIKKLSRDQMKITL